MKDTRILIDTNIIMDWLLQREPFHQNAKAIIEPCINGTLQGFWLATQS
jgi:predicted nucleic acid-binding protein